MKRLYRFFTVIILVAFFFNMLSSQVDFGVKAGLNIANIRSTATLPDIMLDFKPIPSWHIGLVANVGLSDRLFLQPELLLSRLGGKNDKFLSGISTKFTQVLTYVTMPILLEYKLGAFSIEAGPGVGYLLDSRSLDDGKKIPVIIQLFDEKIDLDINAGVKYSFEKIFTQVRWKYSLLPLAELAVTDVNGEPVESASFYNTAIQLSLGYKL